MLSPVAARSGAKRPAASRAVAGSGVPPRGCAGNKLIHRLPIRAPCMKATTLVLALALLTSVSILVAPEASARHYCGPLVPHWVCCHGVDCVVEGVRGDVDDILPGLA